MSRTALMLVAAMGLSACGPNTTDPGEAAERFGQHLSSEQLSDLENVTLTPDSIDPDSLTDAMTALAPYPVEVTLQEAVINESAGDEDAVTATATYEVRWNLDGGDSAPAGEDAASPAPDGDWTYSTQATLVWDEDAESWTPELRSDTLVPGLAPGGQVVVERHHAARGEILDTDADPLATQRPVRRIGIDKMHILNGLQDGGAEPSAAEITETLTERATALAEALDLDPQTFVDRVLTAGERAWVEFIVLRDDGETDIPFEEIAEIPGAVASQDEMILAPTASFARSLLGSYGLPTAEQIENSDGNMTAGVETGLSGLQLMYNDELGGTDGLTISVDNAEVTGESSVTSDPVAFQRETTDGTSITTTLDTQVQELAEHTLEDSDVLAALVAVRPSDGHILAAAEGPAGTSWPVALTGSYAPGSTFKMVTALAMLRNGMTPASTVSCPATIEIQGTEIANFDGYPSQYVGDITLAEAIAQSCNTVFVGQWEDISPDQEHDAAAALGLVADPVTGFHSTILGSVPTDVAGAEHASGLFGQGVVEASPLGMATVAASVAAGHTVAPVLLEDPAVNPETNDHLPGEAPLTAEEAAQLRELMAGPVEDGTVPVLQEVPGAAVLAKTGTAQFMQDGEMLAHTWIMAVHGDVAVALFLHEGFAGAQTNGPILRDFLTELEAIIPSEG